MKLSIDQIHAGERIRRESGELSELMESIRTVGLIHPVLVNEKNELISGFRRLEACRRLGFEDIEVIRVFTEGQAVRGLDLEYHENIGRQNLSESEKQSFRTKRERLLHPPRKRLFLTRWFQSLWYRIRTLFRRSSPGPAPD